jgi:predicted nucleic acid-binding protein
MKNASAICVDTSLVVRLYAVPREQQIRDLWATWQREGQQLVAPALLRYEVTNSLFRYQRAGTLSADAVRNALHSALALPIRFYGGRPLHMEALDRASRHTLPAAYDAHYLALAERFGIEFWTTDQRLFNTVSASLPWVRLVGA